MKSSLRWCAPLAVSIVLLSPHSARAQDVGILEDPPTQEGTQCVGPPTPEAAHGMAEVEGFKDEMKVLQKLMDEIKLAEDSILKKGDWPKAINLYVDVVTTAPHFVKGWRRLCEGYAQVARPADGAHACRQVLASKEATAWDRAMLVHHLLIGPERTKPATRAEVDEQIRAAIKQAPNERWGYDAQCENAEIKGDAPTLASCTHALERLAPDDRRTLALSYGLALREGRYGDADALIARARAAGMEEAALKRLQRDLEAKAPLWWRLKARWPFAALSGLGVVGLAVAARRSSRVRRARE